MSISHAATMGYVDRLSLSDILPALLQEASPTPLLPPSCRFVFHSLPFCCEDKESGLALTVELKGLSQKCTWPVLFPPSEFLVKS